MKLGLATHRIAPAPRCADPVRLAHVTAIATLPPTDVADVLDALDCPALIVDRALRIDHANAGGRSFLREGARRPADAAEPSSREHALPAPLRRAVVEALESVSPAGCARTATCILRVPEAGVGLVAGPVIAHVRPLGTAGQINGFPGYARAIVTIPLARDLASRCQYPFATAFGLTEAETRVLVTLANGRSQKDCAQLLEISPATLRTHLKHIFDKTGMRRQSQLISVFLRTLPP